MKPGPKMGGPNKAFLCPTELGQIDSLLTGAKRTNVKLEGLSFERQWAWEVAEISHWGKDPNKYICLEFELG